MNDGGATPAGGVSSLWVVVEGRTHHIYSVLVGEDRDGLGGDWGQAVGLRSLTGVVVVHAEVLLHVEVLVLAHHVTATVGPALRGTRILEPVDDVGEVKRLAAPARLERVELIEEHDHLLAARVLVLGEPPVEPRDFVFRVKGSPDTCLGHVAAVHRQVELTAQRRVAGG